MKRRLVGKQPPPASYGPVAKKRRVGLASEELLTMVRITMAQSSLDGFQPAVKIIILHEAIKSGKHCFWLKHVELTVEARHLFKKSDSSMGMYCLQISVAGDDIIGRARTFSYMLLCSNMDYDVDLLAQ